MSPSRSTRSKSHTNQFSAPRSDPARSAAQILAGSSAAGLRGCNVDRSAQTESYTQHKIFAPLCWWCSAGAAGIIRGLCKTHRDGAEPFISPVYLSGEAAGAAQGAERTLEVSILSPILITQVVLPAVV